jgi:hypothetical protein
MELFDHPVLLKSIGPYDQFFSEELDCRASFVSQRGTVTGLIIDSCIIYKKIPTWLLVLIFSISLSTNMD